MFVIPGLVGTNGEHSSPVEASRLRSAGIMPIAVSIRHSIYSRMLSTGSLKTLQTTTGPASSEAEMMFWDNGRGPFFAHFESVGRAGGFP